MNNFLYWGGWSIDLVEVFICMHTPPAKGSLILSNCCRGASGDIEGTFRWDQCRLWGGNMGTTWIRRVYENDTRAI